MNKLLLFLWIFVAMPVWARTVCLYDEQNRRTDKIDYESRFTADSVLPYEFPIQMKELHSGKIILPLSANYAESRYLFHYDEGWACFSHRIWLHNLLTDRVEAFDSHGNYLGYEPVGLGDGGIINDDEDGFLPVQKDGKYGLANAITGQLIVYPQYFFIMPFENGRAKATYSGVVKSLSTTDFVPVYLSDAWFYIDTHGNKLPETPPQDNLHDNSKYDDWQTHSKIAILLYDIENNWKKDVADVFKRVSHQ